MALKWSFGNEIIKIIYSFQNAMFAPDHFFKVNFD